MSYKVINEVIEKINKQDGMDPGGIENVIPTKRQHEAHRHKNYRQF